MSKLVFIACLLLIFIHGSSVFGHGNKEHKDLQESMEKIEESIPNSILGKINEEYLIRVKPIFKKKCLDCHGTGNALPWYSELPLAKQLMQSDMKEAKEHMDMSKDFPFAGHGSPRDDLKALEDTIMQQSMPPLRYLIMHWGSSLSKDEVIIVKDWIKNSFKQLNQLKQEKENEK